MKASKLSKMSVDEYIPFLFYFLDGVGLLFLKSLNLTFDQYSKLAEIMEDYGQEKYSDGIYIGILRT